MSDLFGEPKNIYSPYRNWDGISASEREVSIKFGLLSAQDVRANGVVEVTTRNLYSFDETQQKQITLHGPLDQQMGISTHGGLCETCKKDVKDCTGHFGFIRLALPCFHVGYFKKTFEVLQCICKSCSRILLDDHERSKYLNPMRENQLERLQSDDLQKRIINDCKKVKECPHCHAYNAPIKKIPGGLTKIVHDKYRTYLQPDSKNNKDKNPALDEQYDKLFSGIKKHSPELEKHLHKATEELHPIRVLELFRAVHTQDLELLGMNPDISHPEMLLYQNIPAPPVTIRPSVAQEKGSTEDDLTNQISEIVNLNNILKRALKQGETMKGLMSQWEALQLQVSKFINGDIDTGHGSHSKPTRSFVQRLKGKQGRFRGNLSGKRVDFSARTVITPDPNLSVDEVGVPIKIASTLTYPETVNQHNIERLREAVRRISTYPGAKFITKKSGKKITLEVFELGEQSRRQTQVKNLEIGDVVDRHLINGDIVLFNRQPSLHRISILAHKVKIHNDRTLKLNECVCTPYNADFDGDEMNLHVPQTEMARVEAAELMGVQQNLINPKDGAPIIAATQDFITCAYLMTRKDQFFTRDKFCQVVNMMFSLEDTSDPEVRRIDIPEPAIWKPQPLWTGKQVINVMMRPSKRSNVLINFDAPSTQFIASPDQPRELDEGDNWVCVRNSEIMCGALDKNTVGTGKKDNLFYVLMRYAGPRTAVKCMNRLSQLTAKWFCSQGFSFGYDDVFADKELIKQREELVAKAYADADVLIDRMKAGTLEKDAGLSLAETMENKVTQILSKVRQDAGTLCVKRLSKDNSAVIMAQAGSKGSTLNVAQMVATVGQQLISQRRAEYGFFDRTLPHFEKNSQNGPSRGFVQNSFVTGLEPHEFFFHAMAGREGLVDSAVKTAETGYMSRRLMKSLEDISVKYDSTVRTSSNRIIQFQYGEDGLNPMDMEGNAKPVNFEQLFTHALQTTRDNDEPSLTSVDYSKMVTALFNQYKGKFPRMTLTAESLPYDDPSDEMVDEYDSFRRFLAGAHKFLKDKTGTLAASELVFKNKTEADFIGVSIESGSRDGLVEINKRALNEFLKQCARKYVLALVKPGQAVGALAAHAIGEPSTQMTLKSFHFTGLGGMATTKGVPRVKEIINASRSIATPLIIAQLKDNENETRARNAKARIEKIYLKDIMRQIRERWGQADEPAAFLEVVVDREAIKKLHIPANLQDIRKAVLNTRGLGLSEDLVTVVNDKIVVQLDEGLAKDLKSGKAKKAMQSLPKDDYLRLKYVKRALPSIQISGLPDIKRVVISHKEDMAPGDTKESKELLISGYGLKRIMGMAGIEGEKTRTNSILEVQSVLGIEAARTTLVNELNSVIGKQMGIDPRHIYCLADYMCMTGEVLGITRFGLAKMGESILQLASFEKTADNLFEAAHKGLSCPIQSVSESVILGQPIHLGTGMHALGMAPSFDRSKLKRKVTDMELGLEALEGGQKRVKQKVRKAPSEASRDAPHPLMDEMINNSYHDTDMGGLEDGDGLVSEDDMESNDDDGDDQFEDEDAEGGVEGEDSEDEFNYDEGYNFDFENDGMGNSDDDE